MASKKEIRALLRAVLENTHQSWTEFDKVLNNFATLHDELQRLLTQSGLYSKSQTNRLLAELDYLLLRHAQEIGAFERSAYNRAWLRGRDSAERTIATFELSFAKGLTGLEKDLVNQFLTIERIKGVTDEMRALIRAQVLSGIMMEKTPIDVMASITNIIGIRDLRGYRQIGTTGISAKAERIFRTETMAIQNAGAWQANEDAQKQFPDLTEIWAATGDTRTRDTHLIAHGQVKDDGDYFTVGGYKARFPGDPDLPPAERVNCRCNTLPYREEWGTVDTVLGPLTGQINREKGRRNEQ
jgi:hypothetical protein